MAAIKSRSLATGLLALAGLAAAGIAFLGKGPDQTIVTDIPAPEAIVSEVIPDAVPAETAIDKPIENESYDRRRMAMSGSAAEIEAAHKKDRIGTFRTVLPEAKAELPGSKLFPKLGLEAATPLDSRRVFAQNQQVAASETGPIEFIVKLKDVRLGKNLQDEFEKSPAVAARHLKSAMGGGGILQRASLQGFTLGGEAILRFDGPRKVNDFAKVQSEIHRALSAAPGVSYAEQNYTADINSAQ